MKKSLMFIMLGIISFLGINSVSADTYIASNFYSNFDKYIENYIKYEDNVNHLIEMWENKHSSDYPFYFIFYFSDDIQGDYLALYSSNTTEFLLQSSNLILQGAYFVGGETDPNYTLHNKVGYIYSYSYHINTNEYIEAPRYSPQSALNANGFTLIDSNVNPKFKYKEHSYTQGGSVYKENFDVIQLPSFTSSYTSFSTSEIEIKDGENLPTLKSLYNGSYITNELKNYITIDLNKYSYIALSLKDYNIIPEDNYSMYSNLYVKGQLCITSVYNYGMTERKDILTDSEMQGCSVYHNTFSLTRMYILKEDVKNHAIYYLKAYDTSKENVVKIDTSMFDISYITEENKDNPSVSINGKNYPTLSYDSLTDSATISQDNGYTPGISCAVGDMNCYKDNNTNNIFDDIFSSPLEFFEDVFSSVKAIFDIIVEFIALLPPMMQSFLYLSFMLAVVLGLIKIIL